jgi:hypothetical protein
MTTAIACPKCGGDMWDQKGSKFWGTGVFPSGKAKPRWECKTKTCAKEGGARWEPSGANGGAANAVTAGTSTIERPATTNPRPATAQQIKQAFDLESPDAGSELYLQLTRWVLVDVAHEYREAGIGLSPEAAAAIVATLYIQAKRNGQ